MIFRLCCFVNIGLFFYTTSTKAPVGEISRGGGHNKFVLFILVTNLYNNIIYYYIIHIICDIEKLLLSCLSAFGPDIIFFVIVSRGMRYHIACIKYKIFLSGVAVRCNVCDPVIGARAGFYIFILLFGGVGFNCIVS